MQSAACYRMQMLTAFYATFGTQVYKQVPIDYLIDKYITILSLFDKIEPPYAYYLP